MFARFSDSARHVVLLAQNEARSLRRQTVGSEHLLLGLLREEGGGGARVLASLGVTWEAAHAQVLSATTDDGEEVFGRLPFADDAKRALALALRAMLARNDETIGSEDILFGLIRDAEGPAVQVLQGLGVDPAAVERRVIGVLSARRDPSTDALQVLLSRGLKFIRDAQDLAAERGDSQLGEAIDGVVLVLEVLLEATPPPEE
jgi:ATP-dependent Clp protease ATP-binding subunit ClpC